MTQINLQPLFADPILEQTALDPGYEDHGSDVFRVTTTLETVIVRAFRSPIIEGAFWGGLQKLFGINPLSMHNLAALNAQLDTLSRIRVPQVLRIAELDGREWAVVEYLPGHTLEDFAGDDLMYDFGVQVAHIHSHRFPDYGSPTGKRWPLDTFHIRAVETMHWLVENFYAHDTAIVNALDSMCDTMFHLPTPSASSYVQPDIGSNQFLTDGQRVTAWVDTEACVIAPRVLDFIGLEFQIPHKRAAQAFARGYGTVLSLPQLSQVRAAYRYLYLLLDVEGDIPLDEWMNYPNLW